MPKPGVEYTAQLADWHRVAPQAEGENESAFKHRVSAELRAQGHMIEAHEAFNNCRYDDPEDSGPMTGILGGVAQAMQGNPYHSGKESQVGDDIAAGIFSQSLRRDDGAAIALMLMLGDAMRR